MPEILLANGRGVAIVDDEDYERLAAHRWYRHSRGYAARTVWTPGGHGKKTVIYMHREIAGAVAGEDVDHVNQDKLDNRRCNVRRCGRADNNRHKGKPRGKGGRPTSSRFKGVHWSDAANAWVASIYRAGQSRHLGCFQTEELAAQAYDRAASERHGEFAVLNFPHARSA